MSIKQYIQIIALFVFVLALSIRGLAQSETTSSPVQLNFGFPISVLPEVNEQDVKAAIKVWAEDFLDKEYYKTEFYVYDDLDKLIQAMIDGRINIAPLPPIDYIQLNQTLKLYPAVCAKIKESVSDRFVLLARKDSHFVGIQDLADKSLVLKQESSPSLIDTWLEVMLYEADLPPSNRFFSEVIKKEREFQVIFPLLMKQTDCCIITEGAFNTMSELNPQLNTQLMPIVTSDSLMISTILTYTEQLSEEARDYLTSLALKWAANKTSDQLQILFRFNELIPYREKYLENIRTLLKRYNRFLKDE
ncbi:PhnD/SsuA/transferrin family substrate-binding protein [bacterium]|nr:PhnD/SsuA/transferrin family substrate-binding protein [bacterium]